MPFRLPTGLKPLVWLLACLLAAPLQAVPGKIVKPLDLKLTPSPATETSAQNTASVTPKPNSITRNVFIDMGFGVPHLFFLQAQAMLDKKWQLGFGYGLIPGLSLVASNIPLPQQTVTLSGGVDVTTDPVMDANYNTLLPFVRWFPRGDNFYVQFSFTLLKATADVSGDLVDTTTSSTVGNITGTVTVLQPLPMLSVGHIFVGKKFFLNVMIGMSFFLMGASTSVDLDSFIPSSLGGTAGNQAAISELQTNIAESVDSSTADLKSKYPVIPSLSISFGIML